MPSNNPSGKNSPVAFDRFTREIPYGEKRVQGDLQRTVPLAGESAAAAPLNLPREAQRRATRAPAVSPRLEVAPTVAPPAEAPPPDLSGLWQGIAAIPGISPLALEYAQKASG